MVPLFCVKQLLFNFQTVKCEVRRQGVSRLRLHSPQPLWYRGAASSGNGCTSLSYNSELSKDGYHPSPVIHGEGTADVCKWGWRLDLTSTLPGNYLLCLSTEHLYSGQGMGTVPGEEASTLSCEWFSPKISKIRNTLIASWKSLVYMRNLLLSLLAWFLLYFLGTS